MSTMQPNGGYRQSRRSACDRCRGFKLRCERDQVNGQSCERCLKAQVACTTSVGQPIPTFIHPRKDAYSLSRSRVDISEHRDVPTALLHRPTGPRVRKATAASGVCRRIEQQKLNAWIQPGILNFLENTDFPNPSNTEEMQMHSTSHELLAFDQWSQDFMPWNESFLNVSPAYQNTYYGTGNFQTTEDIFCRPEIVDISKDFTTPSTFEPTDTIHWDEENLTTTNCNNTNDMKNPWDNLPSLNSDQYSVAATKHDRASRNSYAYVKSIMKLNVELITDLENLEGVSNLLSSFSILDEMSGRTFPTIELPIYRTLNHSCQFLDIVQPRTVPSVDKFWENPPITPADSHPSAWEDYSSLSKEGPASCFDEMSNFMTTRQPDHVTMTNMLLEVPPEVKPSGNELSISLNIMSTYFQIIGVYDMLFTQLHQLFLMVPSDEAAKILVFPSLKFGKFQMEGQLKNKVEVLIDLSFSMLGRIDQSFNIAERCQSESGAEDSPTSYMPYNSAGGFLGNQNVARELFGARRSLEVTMKCLQAFMRAMADAAI